MMSVLNHAAVEALCSATYLENYLETMENLPDDLQRVITQLRELDIQCRDVLQDVDQHCELYQRDEDGPQKRKSSLAIQRALIKTQEIGDEKLHLLSIILDFIESRTRQLEQDRENLDPTATKEPEREDPPTPVITATTLSTTPITPVSTSSGTKTVKQEEKTEKVVHHQRRQRRQKHNDSTSKDDEKEEKDKAPKKKKKRKAKKEKDESSVEPPIDPDEPTYCICEQVSYGEMIGCDNDACAIEWFHFNCVGLATKPKGRWYCPNCRGESSKVMRKI
ncbi:hypothetical protein ACJMK2_032687 [Sinanodonta woodiana]|uniref:Inhibitor of growth protein n=1 Tax=Sinanodonta woodiana TaxID=1069815 RepID=A0ABD3X6E5_SINWO